MSFYCMCVRSFTLHKFLLTNQIPGPDGQRGPPRCLVCPRRGALTGAKGKWNGEERGGGDLGQRRASHSAERIGEEGKEENRVIKERKKRRQKKNKGE